MCFGINNLPWLGLDKAVLAGQRVDPARLCELRLPQLQLPVLLAQLIQCLLLRFDLISALDRAEVLQPVNHDQRKQHDNRR